MLCEALFAASPATCIDVGPLLGAEGSSHDGEGGPDGSEHVDDLGWVEEVGTWMAVDCARRPSSRAGASVSRACS